MAEREHENEIPSSPDPGHGGRLAQLSELVQLSPGGCLILEGEVIRSANHEAVETMGIPHHRLVGTPLVELLLPEFEQDCRQALHKADGEPEAEQQDRQTVGRRAVRLARGLTPIEIAAKPIDGDLTMVGVRSMADETRYSAQAGGPLTHDLLTGFPNRYHVLAQLKERLDAPGNKPLALVGLWVDELSELGDKFGKRAVQRVVRDVGQRLQVRLRAPDIIGRFDEAGFLVLMSTDADPTQLTEIAGRLRDEVAFPVELDDRLVSFTASVIVGSVDAKSPSVERILALLDSAATRAASSGGNRTDVLSI